MLSVKSSFACLSCSVKVSFKFCISSSCSVNVVISFKHSLFCILLPWSSLFNFCIVIWASCFKLCNSSVILETSRPARSLKPSSSVSLCSSASSADWSRRCNDCSYSTGPTCSTSSRAFSHCSIQSRISETAAGVFVIRYVGFSFSGIIWSDDVFCLVGFTIKEDIKIFLILFI